MDDIGRLESQIQGVALRGLEVIESFFEDQVFRVAAAQIALEIVHELRLILNAELLFLSGEYNLVEL